MVLCELPLLIFTTLLLHTCSSAWHQCSAPPLLVATCSLHFALVLMAHVLSNCKCINQSGVQHAYMDGFNLSMFLYQAFKCMMKRSFNL